MHTIKNALARGLKLVCSKVAFQKKEGTSLFPSPVQHLFEKENKVHRH